jgi:hypothetical protein
MLEYTSPIQLNLTQHEAASVIEAIHDALFRKVRWTISPSYEKWHSLDFTLVQVSIDSLAGIYTSLYMAFREDVGDGDDAIAPGFEKAFIISDEVWAVIDQIREADDWAGVKRHLHGESLCRACRELNRIPKA